MHPKIETSVKAYELYIKNIKEMEALCIKVDELEVDLKTNKEVKSLSYSVQSTSISFNIYVENVKDIPTLLRVIIKYLGKITYRGITPENKHFNFDFLDNIYIYFKLEGDSCKLVQIGSKKVPIYELQCANGEDKIVSKDELEAIGQKEKNDEN